MFTPTNGSGGDSPQITLDDRHASKTERLRVEKTLVVMRALLQRVNNDEDAAQLNREIGLLLVAVGDSSGALEAMQNAFRRSPNSLSIVRSYRKAATRVGDARKMVAAMEAEARLLGSGAYAASLHVERARVLASELGEHEAARLAYRSALDQDPNDASALLALAEQALGDRQHAEAARWLEDLSNVVSDPALVGELRGRAVIELEAAGDTANAYLQAVSARIHAPESLALQYALERLHGARKEHNELCEMREAQIAAGSIDPRQGWFDIGVLAAYRLGDSELAKRAFEQACIVSMWTCAASLAELALIVERDADWPRFVELLGKQVALEQDAGARAHLLFRIGRVHESRLKSPQAAIDSYQAALVASTGYIPALEGAGRLLYRTAGFDQLIEMHLLESSTAPTLEEKAAAQVRAAQLLVNAPARIEEGIALLRGVLTSLPRDMTALDTLAGAYSRSKAWVELISLYEDQLEGADPTRRAWLLSEIARIAADRRGDRKKAIAALEQITIEPSGPPSTLVRLAALLEEDGDWKKLADVLQRTLVYIGEPDQQASLLERLAKLHEQLGEDDRALELYGQAASIAPSGHSVLAAAGRAYLRVERYDELAAILERASVHGPPERKAFWRTKLAQVLFYDLDRVDDAIAALRLALDDSPGYAFASRSLAEALTREERWDELGPVLAASGDAGSRGHIALRLGMIAEAKGDDDRAIARYADAHAAGVDAAQLSYLRLLGPAHAEQAEHMYATMKGSRVCELHARYRAGELAASRPNRRIEAIAYFQEALRIAGNDLGVSLALLPLLRDQPQAHEDMLASLAAKVADPALQAVLQQRRAELVSQTEPDKALAIRRRALEQSPHHPVNSIVVELALESSGERSALAKLLRTQAADSLIEPDLRVSTYCSLGVVLEELGNTRESADAFENACHAAVEQEPWLALLALPRVYAALQNTSGYVSAVRMLCDRIPNGPERATSLRFLGSVLTMSGDRDGAIEALEDALAVQSDCYPALRDLQQLCGESDPDRYIDSLMRTFELAENETAIRTLGCSLAARLIKDDRYESAVEVIDRVLAVGPDDLRGLMLRAEVEERRETWDFAVAALERVIDHAESPAPVKAEALKRLAAIVDVELHDTEALRGVVERLAAIDVTSPDYIRVAVDIYGRVGDHPNLAKALERVASASDVGSGERAGMLLRLAALQDAELGEPAAAIETLARVTDPAHQRDAIARLLELGERSNRWDLACDALEAALSRGSAMDPTWELAIRRRLAGLLEGPLNRTDDAARQYARIATLDVNDAASLERLAAIEEGRDPARALDVHRALLKIDPNRTESYRQMRALFLAMNDDDGAFCAEAALVGLGVANEEEQYFHRQRLAAVQEGSASPLEAAELDALCPERKDVALALLGELESIVQAVFPAQLAAQGIDTSGSMSTTELQDVASAFAIMFAVPRHMVTSVADRIGPTVEIVERPILLVPRFVEAETRQFQRVVCGALFGRIRFHGVATDPRRLNPIGAKHLEYLLWAACSVVREDVLVPEDNAIYKDIRRRVATALAGRVSANLRDLVDRVIADRGAINGERLAKITADAAARSALLAALDPAEAISCLQKLKQQLGLEPLQHVAYVVSKEHLNLRRRRGWGVNA